MSDIHLDHPGEMHWFSGYGPAPVLGRCPHATCSHNDPGSTGSISSFSVIAWGPDLDRYELVTCDADCDGNCRAWVSGRSVATTPWLQVAAAPEKGRS